MERRGFTQSDTTKYLGMHKSMLSLLVNGKRNPGLTTAVELERKTGIPVEDWAMPGDEPDRPPTRKAAKRRVCKR